MFGACGSGTILVLPGIIMVLITAGAAPICRAEYEGCPYTWLVILLFVAPVARHTITGRGGRIVFGSILVLPGTIIILVTAGVSPIRRAEYE